MMEQKTPKTPNRVLWARCGLKGDTILEGDAEYIKDSAIDKLDAQKGIKLFQQACTFMLSVGTIKQLPDTSLPEVAFIGRSNVGKSSLINALVGSRSMARTSNTPGRTQLLNFFNLAETVRLVDLPGYGYAKAPKSQVEAWGRLIDDYLRGRPNLARTFVLVDSRHGLKEKDDQMMQRLDKAAVSYQIILTKIDKINKLEIPELLTHTATSIAKSPAAYPEVLATSAEKYWGLERLKAQIAFFDQ